MYSKVVIIGRTNLVKECLQIMDSLIQKEKITILDLESRKINPLIIYKDLGYNYNHLKSKRELITFLERLEENTLVLSIMNPYIIPANIIQKPNLLLVNLHHALLPNHPGRNAEAWTIYEQDEYGGITWHIIDEGVDSGDILIQKAIRITEDVTSLELYKMLNKMAIAAFREIIKNLLEGDIIPIKQTLEKKHAVRVASERPNQGVLNLEWDEKKISAFLRSMDYGILKTMGDAIVQYENIWYKCIGYEILSMKDRREAEEIYIDLPYLYCHKKMLQFKIKIKLWEAMI